MRATGHKKVNVWCVEKNCCCTLASDSEFMYAAFHGPTDGATSHRRRVELLIRVVSWALKSSVGPSRVLPLLIRLSIV